MTIVTLYTAEALCERALEVVQAQRASSAELELVDITGSRDLEAKYREHLPVVEIGGSARSRSSWMPR